MNHVCKEDKTCMCSILALEPDEDCPVHAQGPWPPRCGQCGRFLSWDERRKEWIEPVEQPL